MNKPGEQLEQEAVSKPVLQATELRGTELGDILQLQKMEVPPPGSTDQQRAMELSHGLYKCCKYAEICF